MFMFFVRGCGGTAIHSSGGEGQEGVVVALQGDADLFLITGALRPACRLARRLHGGQEQREEQYLMMEITTRSSMSVKPSRRAPGARRGRVGSMMFLGAARTTNSGRAAGALAQAHARIDWSYGLRNPLGEWEEVNAARSSLAERCPRRCW